MKKCWIRKNSIRKVKSRENRNKNSGGKIRWNRVRNIRERRG